MSHDMQNDLKLVGTTSASGGTFRNVRVTGEANMNGALQCRSFNCIGTIQVGGSLQAERFKLTGDCGVDGGFRASVMRAVGEVRIGEGLRADTVKIMGELRTGGGCEADTLEIRGGLQVGGTLSADHLELRLHGPSRVDEIGGGFITVKRSRTVSIKRMFGQGANAELHAGLIEGDTLVLEHTRADVVRGNHVTLGAGCVIGRVEYRDELRAGSKATVKERVKL